MEQSNQDTSDARSPQAAIEEANVANILAKLKAGKILSEKEEKKLSAYQLRQEATTAGDTGRTVGVADSMKQAAALAGLSIELLEKAKAQGCPAFRNGRVDVDELTEWLEEFGDTLPTGNKAIDEINIEIAREKLRKVKSENDMREGKLIERATVSTRVEQLGLELKRILRQKLEDEAPRRQREKSEEELRIVNRQLVDEICEAFAKGSEWTSSI